DITAMPNLYIPVRDLRSRFFHEAAGAVVLPALMKAPNLVPRSASDAVAKHELGPEKRAERAEFLSISPASAALHRCSRDNPHIIDRLLDELRATSRWHQLRPPVFAERAMNRRSGFSNASGSMSDCRGPHVARTYHAQEHSVSTRVE